MATIADLWRSILPDARTLGPVSASEATVAWVRVLRPRVPAFDALEPGDLAIVPATALAVVAPAPEDLDGLAGALEAASLAGVVVATEAAAGERTSAGGERTSAGGERPRAGGDGPRAAGEGPDAAEALAQRLADAGLPVLLTAEEPAVLERRVIGYLVNRRAELDRQAAELERQIERLALAGRGADAFAAAVGAFLGRAVVIERRRGEALAIHAPVDRPASASVIARYHARPSLVPLRVPLPGAGGRPAGNLVLLGEDATERERVVCDRVATLLALELSRAGVAAAGEKAHPEGLPSAGPPWVVLVARQGVVPREGVAQREAGAAGEGASEHDPADPASLSLQEREQMRAAVRLLAGPERLSLRGAAESLELRAVAAVDAGDPGGLALAERVAGLLGRTVAASRPFEEASGRPLAEADARATLEAVERLAEPRPSVARADRLPAYRLLGSLADVPDGLRQARALLEPLLVGGPAARRRRLETLRAVLDREAGADAAAALGVHRNTVAYRVRAIERLGGWDLRDPELRLALSVAVRIVRTAQSE